MSHEMPIIMVFRQKTGCRQYNFANTDDLKKWCSRKPYANESVGFRIVRENRNLSTTYYCDCKELPELYCRLETEDDEKQDDHFKLLSVANFDGYLSKLCLMDEDDDGLPPF